LAWAGVATTGGCANVADFVFGTLGTKGVGGGSSVVNFWSVMSANMSASCLMGSLWVALMGAIGEAAAGCRRAWIRSWAAEVAASVHETVRVLTLVGNQMTVSAMRSEVISRIQTR
jgi:hypothetical protein